MIQESKLRQNERDAMFLLIQLVLSGIPFKIRSFFPRVKIRQIKAYVNIFIWLYICIIFPTPASADSGGVYDE